MSRWSIIRVSSADAHAVQHALVDALAPITMRINPVVSPEVWEFAVQDEAIGNVITAAGPGRVLDADVRVEPALAVDDSEMAPPDPSVSAYHQPPVGAYWVPPDFGPIHFDQGEP
jgi:hypothetical protein